MSVKYDKILGKIREGDLTQSQADALYLNLDQSTSQEIINGFPHYESGHAAFPLGTNLIDKDYVDLALQQDEYLIQSRTVNAGTEFSGTYVDSQSQDDGTEWVLREQSGANGLNVECNFTSINLDRLFTRIYIHGWYDDGAAEVVVQLWDYVASDWETYDTFIATNHISFKTILISDPEDHVDGSGNAIIRFYQTATGATNRYLHLDYVALVKQGFGGTTTDHGSLSGLLDDDHTQYVKKDPAGPPTGNIMQFNASGDAHDYGWSPSSFAVTAKGVTNGDSHDHSGGDGAQIDHGNLTGLGDNDHTQYAQKTNVLEKDNTTAFTPDADYEPATKKYVDDNAGGGGIQLSDNNAWTGTNSFNEAITLKDKYIQKSKVVSFDAVWNYLTDPVSFETTWRDDTTEAGTSGGTAFEMGGTNQILQDCSYLGYSAKHAGFAIDAAVRGDGVGDTYQYWNGTVWVNITSSLYKIKSIGPRISTGYILWNPDLLTYWTAATPTAMGDSGTPNDSLSKYWIRILYGEADPEAPHSTVNQIAIIPNFYVAEYYASALATDPAMKIPVDGSLILKSLQCPLYETASGAFAYNTGSTIASDGIAYAFNNNGGTRLRIYGNGKLETYGDIVPLSQMRIVLSRGSNMQAIATSADEGSSSPVAYNVVYIDSAGEAEKAKADSANTMPAIGMVAEVSDTGNTIIATHGSVYKSSWGLTVGALYYVSDATAGDITATKPTASGSVVQPIGIATSANNLFIMPSLNETVI